ncbi:MAG: hypothetical protein Q6L50_03135 [Gloeomargarita sp. GMQP_bins_120]
MELTMQVVPRGCQRALAAGQQVDLELKKASPIALSGRQPVVQQQ